MITVIIICPLEILAHPIRQLVDDFALHLFLCVPGTEWRQRLSNQISYTQASEENGV